MSVKSESFLGASLVVQDLPLLVLMLGTEATARQGICDLLLASRYHLLASFRLNRFNSNNQNCEEEAIFPPSQEKRKKSAI